MNVLVLGGGTGAEKEVSLRSAAAVCDALTDLGHHVRQVDPAEGDATVLKAAAATDLVFPMLHGTGGEDGVIQRLLDTTGKPYLGSGAAASALCFDKARFKDLLEANDILTPQSEVVTAEAFEESKLVQAPFVLKPVAEGSSVGMMLTRELPYDQAKAHDLFHEHKTMLLEELIVGPEITVPVLGSKALPVIEIVPPSGKEFDYENKYNGATAELCPPRSVSPERQEQAQRLAERVHALSGARHLSRIDMMIDAEEKLYVLELNTMPGMTAQSLFPKSAAVAGLAWNELVKTFVDLVWA
ncbi:MAG TPA: D-alanine--D-alanine ligase [Candidatus Saccharimonadia bacterium]|nr:D-alanine--D-alanine ligase [Candidatus Saccharimonadia bacterium]